MGTRNVGIGLNQYNSQNGAKPSQGVSGGAIVKSGTGITTSTANVTGRPSVNGVVNVLMNGNQNGTTVVHTTSEEW